MIIETLVVSPFAANCYVIGCEESKSGAIIDPGDEAGRILQTVGRLGLKIDYILLTHAHIDHIGAAKEVAEATQAPLSLHKADLPLLQAGGGGPYFGLPAPPCKEPDLWLEDAVDDRSLISFFISTAVSRFPFLVSFFIRIASFFIKKSATFCFFFSASICMRSHCFL